VSQGLEKVGETLESHDPALVRRKSSINWHKATLDASRYPSAVSTSSMLDLETGMTRACSNASQVKSESSVSVRSLSRRGQPQDSPASASASAPSSAPTSALAGDSGTEKRPQQFLKRLKAVFVFFMKIRKACPFANATVMRKLLFGDENGESYILNPEKLKQMLKEEAGIYVQEEDQDGGVVLDAIGIPQADLLLVAELLKACCELRKTLCPQDQTKRPPTPGSSTPSVTAITTIAEEEPTKLKPASRLQAAKQSAARILEVSKSLRSVRFAIKKQHSANSPPGAPQQQGSYTSSPPDAPQQQGSYTSSPRDTNTSPEAGHPSTLTNRERGITVSTMGGNL